MNISNMIKRLSFVTTVSLLLILSFQASAQQRDSLLKTKWQTYNEYSRWSIGVNIGLPYFAGDLRSAANDKTYWGIMSDIQLGYQITPVIGTKLTFGYAFNKAGAKNYEKDYYLTNDAFGYYGINPPSDAVKYNDIYSEIPMWNFGLGIDININNLFRFPQIDRRWTFVVTPTLYLQKFGPKLYRKSNNERFGKTLHNPFRIGLGGDASVRFKVSKLIDLQLKGGMNWINNKKFDGIASYSPNHSYNSVSHIEVGVIFKLNKNKKKNALIYASKYKPIYVERTPRVVTETRIDTVIVKVPVVQERVKVVTKKELPTLPNIYFSRGSSHIDTEKYKHELTIILGLLKDISDVNIEIFGYADHTGSDDINSSITTERAEALKNYLIQNGIDESRIIKVVGMGKDMNLVGEDALSIKARRSVVKKK